jgi:hypothetical protein
MLDERFPAVAGTTAQLVSAVEEGTLDDPSVAAAVVDGPFHDALRRPHGSHSDDLPA